MPTSARTSHKAVQWLVLGCLMAAACTDSTAPAPVPVKLAFTVQPSSATAGVAINPIVAVAIEDASGNPVTSATNPVTVTIEGNASGGSLTGTATMAAVQGVARFSDLRIAKAGTGYTLKAVTTRLAAATSTAFEITAGPATKLVFTTQPSTTMGGAAITPPVEVVAQDSVGNPATGFGDRVTVALGGNPAPGTLSGTTEVNAVRGVAIFRDLSIAQQNAGYTLIASAGAVTGVTSAPFAIAKPTATLRIPAATSGSSLDSDGYTICVDPASDGQGGTSCAYGGLFPVMVNGTRLVTVDTGAHAVLLTDVAGNCAVAGDNPRTVHARRGETAEVPFAIACVAVSLHVTATTTGVSLDPDGYYVCVDVDDSPWDYGCGLYEAAIGANGGVTMPVAAGSHVISLYGVAPNCTVSGDNPRTVTANANTEVPFGVTCAPTGSVRVTTATGGTDPDLDGYGVCIDGSRSPCFWSAGVAPIGAATLGNVTSGPHTVTLTALAENCTVSGGALAP